MFCSRFYVKRERIYYVLSEKHNVEPQEEEKDKYQTRSVFLVTLKQPSIVPTHRRASESLERAESNADHSYSWTQKKSLVTEPTAQH